jgi:hypothetical protein
MAGGWLDRLARSLTGQASARVELRTILGFQVEVTNTRDDIDTGRVFERAIAVLERVAAYQPWRLAHLRRDIDGIVVKRFPCRGAYFSGSRTCLLELTFMANDEFSDSQVAACLVHEGMHARLDRLTDRFGITPFSVAPARHERICRRAELDFGEAVPDGGPVIARAAQSLELDDHEVAPAIDWDEADRKIALADFRARR